MGAWLNIGCGPFRAPEPWVNVDVVRIPGQIEPDLVADSWDPGSLPVKLGSVKRIYLGHVLEHVRWDRVHYFLWRCLGLLAPGGEIAVVGPDTNRMLQRWRDGLEPWGQVLAVLEDDVHAQQAPAEWDGARHQWNAYEARVVRALTAAGFVDVTAVPVTEEALARWPVASHAPHQCAVIARKDLPE